MAMFVTDDPLEDEHFVHRRIQFCRVCKIDKASIFVLYIFLCDPTGRRAAPSDVDGDTVLYNLGEGPFQRGPT